MDENGIMYATGHPRPKKRRYLLFKIGKRCLEYCWKVVWKRWCLYAFYIMVMHAPVVGLPRYCRAHNAWKSHSAILKFFSDAPEIYRLMIAACKKSECILFFAVRNAGGRRTIFRIPCISMYILSCLWCEWCLVKHVVQYGYHCLFTLPCVALFYRLLFMALASSLCIPSFQCMLVLCCSICVGVWCRYLFLY